MLHNPGRTRTVVVISIDINDHILVEMKDRNTGAIIPGMEQLGNVLHNTQRRVTAIADDAPGAVGAALEQIHDFVERTFAKRQLPEVLPKGD